MQRFLFQILLFWTVSKHLLLAWYEKRIFSRNVDDCNQQRAFSGVVDVVEGDSFTLCCDVNRPANWTKNGVDVMALDLDDDDSSRYKIEENSLGIRTHLSVSRAMYEQDNEVAYQCVATSPSGEAVVAERKVRVRRKADVSFHGPRSLVVEATVGDNAVLNCSGRHLFFIKWFKDGLFAGAASRFRVSSWRRNSHAIRGTVLYITSVQILDGGRYECRGYPQWGALHRVVTVTLKVFPAEPPRFLEEPRSVLAHLNTTVSLRCSVNGRPRPRLYWIREGKVGGYRERLSGHVNVVTIRSLSHEDEGAYYCVAENSVASVPSSPAVISIIVPVLFVQEVTVMVTNLLEEQEHVLITCAFHYPTNVTWLKDGEPIDGHDSRIFFSKTERNFALAISHSSYRDQGLYMATSFVNGKQIQTCQTRLSIIGPPLPPELVFAGFICKFGNLTMHASWSPPKISSSDMRYLLKLTVIDVEKVTVWTRQEAVSTVEHFNFWLNRSCQGCSNSLAYLLEVYSINSYGQSKPSLPKDIDATSSLTYGADSCGPGVISIPIVKSYPGFQIRLEDKNRTCYKKLETDLDRNLKSVMVRFVSEAMSTSNYPVSLSSNGHFTYNVISNPSFSQFIIQFVLTSTVSVELRIQAIKAVQNRINDFAQEGRFIAVGTHCTLNFAVCTTFYAKGIIHANDCKIS